VKISRLFVIGLMCTMLLIFNSGDKIEAATLQDLFDGDSVTTEDIRFDYRGLTSATPETELERSHISQVPIPGGVWLLSTGLLVLILIRRKNR